MRRVENLTTFMCRLSSNLGASTSWKFLGLSRPVMELLYLLKAVLVLRFYMVQFWKYQIIVWKVNLIWTDRRRL